MAGHSIVFRPYAALPAAKLLILRTGRCSHLFCGISNLLRRGVDRNAKSIRHSWR